MDCRKYGNMDLVGSLSHLLNNLSGPFGYAKSEFLNFFLLVAVVTYLAAVTKYLDKGNLRKNLTLSYKSQSMARVMVAGGEAAGHTASAVKNGVNAPLSLLSPVQSRTPDHWIVPPMVKVGLLTSSSLSSNPTGLSQ